MDPYKHWNKAGMIALEDYPTMEKMAGKKEGRIIHICCMYNLYNEMYQAIDTE